VLLRTAYRGGANDTNDAEDIVQDALCNYIARCRVKEIADPFNYMYASVINGLASRYRVLGRVVPLWPFQHPVWDSVDDRLDDEMDIARIKAAGGEPLLEYYQWWHPKATIADRVWAHRLRQRVRERIR
jgi:DNA-directed RNA polymerase specialized sigma24 family protein